MNSVQKRFQKKKQKRKKAIKHQSWLSRQKNEQLKGDAVALLRKVAPFVVPKIIGEDQKKGLRLKISGFKSKWRRGRPGAYLGGGHGPPFGSLGLQNCIVKWAKLRHGPPLCKLGIRLSSFWLEIWVSSGERTLSKDLFFFFFALHLNLAEKWDEIWEKTFFFCALYLNLAEKWD